MEQVDIFQSLSILARLQSEATNKAAAGHGICIGPNSRSDGEGMVEVFSLDYKGYRPSNDVSYTNSVPDGNVATGSGDSAPAGKAPIEPRVASNNQAR
jgi:hypothetical protein